MNIKCMAYLLKGIDYSDTKNINDDIFKLLNRVEVRKLNSFSKLLKKYIAEDIVNVTTLIEHRVERTDLGYSVRFRIKNERGVKFNFFILYIEDEKSSDVKIIYNGLFKKDILMDNYVIDDLTIDIRILHNNIGDNEPMPKEDPMQLLLYDVDTQEENNYKYAQLLLHELSSKKVRRISEITKGLEKYFDTADNITPRLKQPVNLVTVGKNKLFKVKVPAGSGPEKYNCKIIYTKLEDGSIVVLDIVVYNASTPITSRASLVTID